LFFAPNLSNQAPFDKPNTVVAVNGKITGRLGNVAFRDLKVSGVESTTIALSGHITGLPDALKAHYDVVIKDVTTTKADIEALLGDKIPASINIPASLGLTGSVKGSFSDFVTDISLTTSSGDITVKGNLRQLPGDTQYTASLTTSDLDIGYFLKSEIIGP